MEVEFFCKPGTDLEWHAYWKDFCINWLKSLGIKEEEMRARDHSPEELCFYSKATTDIEFLFPFGWGELWGIADRTDYDLTQHQNTSGQDMSYFDDEKKERYVPYVIEPSLGADRVTLAFLCAAYDEEEIGEGDVRTVLHFHPAIAPVKVGVLPLSKKLNEGAEKIYMELSKYFNCEFDDRGNIGKRYRRQDGAAPLSDIQAKKLEAIGMDWRTPHESAWEVACLKAEAYQKEHGNLEVPKGYRSEGGFRLDLWLNRQKKNYRNGSLDASRKERLTALGIRL